MLAAAADEPEVGDATAACLVLGEAANPTSPVALAGWAIQGAGRRDAVVRAAMTAAGLTDPVPTWECGATLAGVLQAIEALQAGRTEYALVVADDPGALACATVWRMVLET